MAQVALVLLPFTHQSPSGSKMDLFKLKDIEYGEERGGVCIQGSHRLEKCT